MVGLGRGGAGAVGAWRRSEVGEDGAHNRRGLDGGDNAQLAATAGTGQDIKGEHPAHQRRPGPGGRRAAGAGASLRLRTKAVRSRATVADDLGAPARPWSADAVIEKHVHRGAGNEGGERLSEFDGLKQEVRGAIAPDSLEFNEDAPVGAEVEAVLSERGAEEISAIS